MAAEVIQGRFSNLTPPGAHPALQAASDYGMACNQMARYNLGTPEYDAAFQAATNAIADLLDALGPDGVAPCEPPNRNWWCPTCQGEVPPERVTYEETHDPRAGGCGSRVLTRNADAMACETPPAPCPSYGRCTYPDCGHFLDVTRGVRVGAPPAPPPGMVPNFCNAEHCTCRMGFGYVACDQQPKWTAADGVQSTLKGQE